MANNVKLAVTTKNARLDAITTAIGTSGIIKIYDGTQATNPDTAVGAQVLLATLTCSSAFGAAASGGVLTANTLTAGTAGNTGTASWARICTSGGTPKVDCTVGTSGTDLIIDNTSITSGQSVSGTSLTLTDAN